MQHFNPRQISAFKAVMECGSMTAAAKVMNISQPNVSRLVAELEAEAELQLFERRAGRLIATAEGNAFYAEVERLFGGLARLKQAAADIKVFSQGSIRIAATPSFATGFLPEVIRRLTASHPAATVSLQLRSTPTITQWAAGQQCDLGLVWNTADVPGVEMETLFTFPGICIMPQGHRLAARKVIRPPDLEGERFLSFPLDDGTRRRVDHVFDQQQVNRLLALETQYSTAIYSLAAAGVGVSIVNPVPLRDFLPKGIVARPFKPEIMLTSYLLKPQHRARSQLAETFAQLLREVAREELAFLRKVLGLRAGHGRAAG